MRVPYCTLKIPPGLPLQQAFSWNMVWTTSTSHQSSGIGIFIESCSSWCWWTIAKPSSEWRVWLPDNTHHLGQLCQLCGDECFQLFGDVVWWKDSCVHRAGDQEGKICTKCVFVWRMRQYVFLPIPMPDSRASQMNAATFKSPPTNCALISA